MKINHKLLIAGIATILLSACRKEYLEKSDPTKIGTETFYKNKTEADQAVNGVYGILQNIGQGQWLLTEQITDNTAVDLDPGNRGNAPSLETFEFMTVTSGNGYLADMYNRTYNGIYNINVALTRIPEAEMSEEEKAVDIGQLKFLRGYFYFLLVQYFGDVIVVTEPLVDPADAYNFQRKPVDTAYALILQDLTDAVANLPESYPPAELGRATKGAALTLLGKVYLTRKQYPEAQEALSQITGLGYSLVPNYADAFNPAKKNGTESIFDIQYQGDNDQGEWSDFIYSFAPRLSGAAVIGWAQANPGGWNTPSKDIINAYEPDDLRKDVSIGLDFASPVTGDTIPYVKKYAHPHTINGRTNDNWPVLRYSDALLMLAETINEQGGPTGEAYTYINDVRARAGLPALSGLSQSSFRDTLEHERRVELAFENQRWFDLKRMHTPAEVAVILNEFGAKEKANPTVDRQGVAFSAQDYIFTENEVLYPIPNREIITNSSLTQNPGY